MKKSPVISKIILWLLDRIMLDSETYIYYKRHSSQVAHLSIKDIDGLKEKNTVNSIIYVLRADYDNSAD